MLDFGCGTGPYRHLFRIDEYLGLEIDAPGHPPKHAHSTLLYFGDHIPLDNDSVDSILMAEVLEHVFNPAKVLAEFHRILRPGGSVLISCPFAWPLYEEPYDYARYTPYALHHLLQSSGLQVKHIEKTGDWFLVVMQMILSYMVQNFLPKAGRLNRVGKIVFCAILNPLAIVLNFFVPKDERLYFSNIVVACKK
jgi:SAM-dependent methyltransferase